MTESFKKFLIVIIALIIGYGSSYLLNQSPIKFVQKNDFPACVIDCGFSPTDYYKHSDKFGVPITYKKRVVLNNGVVLDGDTNYNNLLIDNLIFIGAAELIALVYIVVRSRRKKL